MFNDRCWLREMEGRFAPGWNRGGTLRGRESEVWHNFWGSMTRPHLTEKGGVGRENKTVNKVGKRVNGSGGELQSCRTMPIKQTECDLDGTHWGKLARVSVGRRP